MDFSSTLINWYLENKRDLPWRKSKNPYHVWLSEIILQQTRVVQGMPYFYKFTENFPTVFHLAEADESKVLKLWQGLGYYSRARNLHFSAKYIVNTLNGIFPNNYKDLLKLKGVGDYTASAIASICFNEPTAVVDGNVYRVLSRYFGIETPINSTKGIKEFKSLAQKLIDKNQASTYNQAIMDFGAIQCKPQNPLCNTCPFEVSCIAFNNNSIKFLPVKEKKIKIKKRYFNFLVTITKNQKVLLEERTQKGIWQGLYQFPLIESNHSIDEQELISQTKFAKIFNHDCTIELFNPKEIVHKLSHQHLYTKFWIIKTSKTSQKDIDWSKIEEYPVPILIKKFLDDFDLKKHD